MSETLNLIPLCRCCHKNGVFKNLFYDFIYNENEIENYSQMLYDTFGISVELSERDEMHTICDGCIETLRLSMEFKNGILACGKNIKPTAAATLVPGTVAAAAAAVVTAAAGTVEAPARTRAVAAGELGPSPRRRRRRQTMSREAARRALVRSSRLRAEAAVRSRAALERISQSLERMHNTLQRIGRMGSFAFPRSRED